LRGPALQGGAEIGLDDEPKNFVTIPGSVTIPEGECSTRLDVRALPAGGEFSQVVTIAATFEGVTRRDTVTVSRLE